MVRGNMISILIDTVYGGGASPALAGRVSSATGIAALEAIIARLLMRDFIRLLLKPSVHAVQAGQWESDPGIRYDASLYR
jgi:hypothetical protein